MLGEQMNVSRLIAYTVFGVLVLPSVGRADQVCPRDKLGVARVTEIDTAGRPWFGEPQGNPVFLAPKEVVLTFDDGPLPRYTRPILAAPAAQSLAIATNEYVVVKP
jgi:hypothetical protein